MDYEIDVTVTTRGVQEFNTTTTSVETLTLSLRSIVKDDVAEEIRSFIENKLKPVAIEAA
jgi:hypothetical protein